MSPRPPLPQAVVAQLAKLPSGGDVERFRDEVYASGKQLARHLATEERRHGERRMTDRQLAELLAWLSYLVAVRGFRMNTTAAQYCRAVGRLLTWAHAAGKDHNALITADFDDWMKWLMLSHRNAMDWRNSQAAAVRNFYRWRHERGVGRNCAEHVRIGKRGIRMAKRYTDDQLRKMLAHTEQREYRPIRVRDKAILLLLVATGIRREETINISLHDLEFGTNCGVVRIHGKGAKEREVPFEGPVVRLLSDWLAMREDLKYAIDPDAVFVTLHGGARGRRMSVEALEDVVSFHAQGIGLRSWGVHRFRVNYATALYDEGKGLEEIRVLLGHESILTTRRYIAVSDRARRTRVSASYQHKLLGQSGDGQPRWMRAALGGLNGGA